MFRPKFKKDIIKEFYKPCQQVLAQSYRQVQSWKRINQVTVLKGYHDYIEHDLSTKTEEDNTTNIGVIGSEFEGKRWQKNRPSEQLPRPIQRFGHYQWPLDIRRQLNLAQFKSPTPIQSVAWPLLLSGYCDTQRVHVDGRLGAGSPLFLHRFSMVPGAPERL